MWSHIKQKASRATQNTNLIFNERMVSQIFILSSIVLFKNKHDSITMLCIIVS